MAKTLNQTDPDLRLQELAGSIAGFYEKDKLPGEDAPPHVAIQAHINSLVNGEDYSPCPQFVETPNGGYLTAYYALNSLVEAEAIKVSPIFETPRQPESPVGVWGLNMIAASWRLERNAKSALEALVKSNRHCADACVGQVYENLVTHEGTLSGCDKKDLAYKAAVAAVDHIDAYRQVRLNHPSRLNKT